MKMPTNKRKLLTDSGKSEPILPFAAEITGDFTWCKIANNELLPTPNLRHPAYFDGN
jgi:hypothetical protein